MRPPLLARRDFVFRGIVVASGLSGCAAGPSRPRPRAQPVRSDVDEPRAMRIRASTRSRRPPIWWRGTTGCGKEAKLHSLMVSKKLQAAANEQHARDMAEHKKMTHTGSDGSTPSSRITARGYRMRRSGENIAFGQRTRGRRDGQMDEKSRAQAEYPRQLHRNRRRPAPPLLNGASYWCVSFGLPVRPR